MIYNLENISFSYNKREVLTIDNLLLEEGRIYLLSGPNGSGKTTFLKLLNGLLRPESGKVLFKDMPIDQDNYKQIRQDSVYVHQNPILLSGTVYTNISYGLKIRKMAETVQRKITLRMLEMFNLKDLETRKSGFLSGGEIKRVAIARALAINPKILLLDEPMAHIDKDSVENIQKILKEINEQENTTIIFSSHNGTFNNGTSVEKLLIKNGRIVKE